MFKKASLLIFLLLFVGCGYKPTSHYAKQKIKGNVFVDMFISIKDPKNSVIIKDAMSEILVSRFDAKLVHDKKLADTTLFLRLNSVSMQVLQYDAQGYEQLYRATVSIDVSYASSSEKGSVKVTGSYDFAVDGQNDISEAKRFEAIKNASSKALEEVISKLAINTFKKEPTKENEEKK